MALHVFLFLLVFFLILCLALLWHLYWLHLQPSHSRVGAMHTTAQLYWLLGTSVRLISTVRNGLPFLNRLQIEEGEGKIESRHTILILLRRSSHVMENVILWVVFSPIFC